MITISAEKVAGFTPRWAPFPGFSLLFDSPGVPYRQAGGFETLACDVTGDPALGFYRRVYEGFAKFDIDRLLKAYLFCALPPESYHVTAFDVVNWADLSRGRSEWRDSLRGLLGEVPGNGWGQDHALLAPSVESALVTEIWSLRLKYDKLEMFGRGGILLRLQGADEESRAELDRFTRVRAALSNTYRERFGMGAGPKFGPHLSIGYFANEEGAELAVGRVAEWDARLRDSVGDEILAFETASLYAFPSMDTFIRRAR